MLLIPPKKWVINIQIRVYTTQGENRDFLCVWCDGNLHDTWIVISYIFHTQDIWTILQVFLKIGHLAFQRNYHAQVNWTIPRYFLKIGHLAFQSNNHPWDIPTILHDDVCYYHTSSSLAIIIIIIMLYNIYTHKLLNIAITSIAITILFIAIASYNTACKTTNCNYFISQSS